MQHLIPADAVRSESLGAYFPENLLIGIGLHGIVNSEIVFLSQIMNLVNSTAKQIHVVKIERGGYFFKSVDCI